MAVVPIFHRTLHNEYASAVLGKLIDVFTASLVAPPVASSDYASVRA